MDGLTDAEYETWMWPLFSSKAHAKSFALIGDENDTKLKSTKAFFFELFNFFKL